MASYTVRVVLHDATWSDYLRLATEMGTLGFTDEIRGDNGYFYKMPGGEYDLRDVSWDYLQVRTLAAHAAAKTGRPYAVMVTEATNRAWIGLPLVTSNAIAAE